MSIDLVSFDTIAGVPIYYARQPVAKYGTKGKGPRTVRLDLVFHKQLDLCLTDLWSRCPWGRPEALVSGGCYVEKAGRHGEGRAIDIDALWWTGAHPRRPLVTLQAPNDPVLYLGVEAVLRRHFGTVLDFWFGHGHEDHWHVDNGQPQGWTGKPPTVHAETLFMQAALKFVHEQDIGPCEIDGIMGKATKTAFANVVSDSDIKKSWDKFLDLTASVAFSKL